MNRKNPEVHIPTLSQVPNGKLTLTNTRHQKPSREQLQLEQNETI